MIKEFRSPRNLFFVLEEADLCVRGGFEFGCELFGLRCGLGERGLAVCTGLESPRVLVGTPCRCCGTE